MSASVPRVLVIGGGFSGCLASIQLDRAALAASVPLQIMLLNTGSKMGRGVAYSASRIEHLLNVPARNMSAFPEEPTHFVDWLCQTNPMHAADPQLPTKFMPRMLYGDYISKLYQEHLAASNGRIQPIEGEAIAVRAATTGGSTSAEVELADGRLVRADKVVLATGNESPIILPGADSPSVITHKAWVANPWNLDWDGRHAPPSEDKPIVLLGTGLTTVDCIVTLLEMGWKGKIHAVSRGGLFPLSHFASQPPAHVVPNWPPADIDSINYIKLKELMLAECDRLKPDGLDRLLVDRMRPHTQRVWQGMSSDEKKEFMTSYAGKWNVLRHRIAPQLYEQLQRAVAEGRLIIHKGAVANIQALNDEQLNISLKDARSGAELPSLTGSLVINCTGPHPRFSLTKQPLLQQLLRDKLVQPDDLDLGVQADPASFRVMVEGNQELSQNLQPSPILYAVGPLLKGMLWESIAVPELRVQARDLANSIVGKLKHD